jgi:hypothetical protein
MTEKPVPLSITINIYGQQIKYEKEIAIHELEKNISTVVQELGCQVLQAGIKGVDEELRLNLPPDWQNVGTEKRSVISSVGWIQYKRRIYQDSTGKRWKPVDDVLGLEPYARMSNQVEQMGAYLASESNYREAAERLSWLLKTDISHSVIQRMSWKVGNQIADMVDMEREQIFTRGEGTAKGNISSPILYGESDGVWLHLQREEKKSLEVRVGIMYTGKKPVGETRYALENKSSVIAMGMSSEAWQEELLRVGHQTYDLDQVQLLVTGGDGNSWVKTSFARFDIPQEHVLDRFHLSRAVKRALGSQNANLSHDMVEQIREKGIAAVSHDLLEMIRQSDGKPKEKIHALYRYLWHNRTSLQDLVYRGYAQDLNSLGAIEGNVDKLVVRRMKGRGRSWRLPGMRAMLAICQHRQSLKNLAFEFQPITKVSQPERAKQNQHISYSECFQGRMPIFSGPDHDKPWVRSLYRYVHHL